MKLALAHVDFASGSGRARVRVFSPDQCLSGPQRLLSKSLYLMVDVLIKRRKTSQTLSYKQTHVSESFAMAFWSSIARALLLLLPLVSALKFDLQAHTGHSSKYERCIRNFVAKDTLVVVTAIVSGNKGDGQMVNMHVSIHQRRFHWACTAFIISYPDSRSVTLWATNTASQRILPARLVWPSPLMRMLHSTSVSKINWSLIVSLNPSVH